MVPRGLGPFLLSMGAKPSFSFSKQHKYKRQRSIEVVHVCIVGQIYPFLSKRVYIECTNSQGIKFRTKGLVKNIVGQILTILDNDVFEQMLTNLFNEETKTTTW